MTANPFYELYLADAIPASEFVTLFSTTLIPHVQQLFLPGNVVVVGMQGSGKSMLLTLLQAETRIKYDSQNSEFPIAQADRKFVSANINLAHANAIDFGYRDWLNNDPAEVAMMFGDFVNAILVKDLIQTIKAYIDYGSQRLLHEVGLNDEAIQGNELANAVSKAGLWEGWLADVSNIDDIEARLEERIRGYRSYLHRRSKSIAEEIIETKTPIGDPIAEFSELLKQACILDKDTKIFVDIDQCEELGNIKTGAGNKTDVDYRSVVNRALSKRDPRISYRIGARKYSWAKHSQIFGSSGKLEEERDYKYVDLDLLLKRRENAKTYIFPVFAEDVFRRRMKASGISSDINAIGMDSIYGKPLTSAEKAKFYNTSPNPEKLIKIQDSWRTQTKQRLTTLAKSDLLSARLGEAWIRQKGDKADLNVRNKELPWETQTYWKKERIEISLLQLASSGQQRPIYCGKLDICDLSGGNILTFISINQHIWDEYFKYETASSIGSAQHPKIGIDLQSTGIFNASAHWYQRIQRETGRNDEREKFIRESSRFLREKLMADRKLSYPGANGFSLKDEELDQVPALREFLEEMVDYGNLFVVEHTTKERNRSNRKKWYFNPILNPYLRLSYKRVKEPYYAKIHDVLSWFDKSTSPRLYRHSRHTSTAQQTLI